LVLSLAIFGNMSFFSESFLYHSSPVTFFYRRFLTDDFPAHLAGPKFHIGLASPRQYLEYSLITSLPSFFAFTDLPFFPSAFLPY